MSVKKVCRTCKYVNLDVWQTPCSQCDHPTPRWEPQDCGEPTLPEPCAPKPMTEDDRAVIAAAKVWRDAQRALGKTSPNDWDLTKRWKVREASVIALFDAIDALEAAK